MQVFLESIGELGHRIEVLIPRQNINDKVAQEFARVSKQASLPGFRKGQVPKKVLWERYAKGLRADIVERTIDETLPQAIKEKDLNIVGGIVLEKVEDQDDQDLRYVLTVEVRPSVELKPFSDLQVEKTVVAISDTDVQEALELIRHEQAQWEDIHTRTVLQSGDRLRARWTDLDAEGQPIPTHPSEDVVIQLRDDLPVEVTSALVGKSVGETAILRFYLQAAGREIHASLEVLAIQERQPLSDEALLAHFGGRFESWDALLAEVRRNLQEAADKHLRESQEEAVFDALLAAHVINLPPRLYERELANVRAEAGKAESIDELARKRLTLGFLVSAIVEKYGLKLDRASIDKDARDFARYMKSQEGSKFSDKDYKELMARMEHAALLKQVVDVVLKDAKINETTVAYADFMKDMRAKGQQQPAHVDHEEAHVHGPHCQHGHDHDHHAHA